MRGAIGSLGCIHFLSIRNVLRIDQRILNTTQLNTSQRKTKQRNPSQHNTTQHNTTQHNTTRHDTTQRVTTQPEQVIRQLSASIESQATEFSSIPPEGADMRFSTRTAEHINHWGTAARMWI